VSALDLEHVGTSSVSIEIYQKKVDLPLFAGMVGPGDIISISGQDKGTLGTEISIYINGALPPIKVHTSCSQPIGIGMPIGDILRVLKGYSLKGGLLCSYEDALKDKKPKKAKKPKKPKK